MFQERALIFAAALLLALSFSACNAPDCVPAKVVDSAANCCSYVWATDDGKTGDVWYKQPLHAFPDTATAEAFIGSVSPLRVFQRPFAEGDAHVGQGWHYNSGDMHAAIDYSNYGPVPTFLVRAVASGIVVTKHWDDWVGNIVVIEHVDPSGLKFRSVYVHLRDGLLHDVAHARAIPASAVGEAGDKWDRYRKFAALPVPNPVWWGTEAEKIRVEVGDKVEAGQVLANSGNTGAGGAGAGLDASGVPTSPSGNVHLHFALTIAHPKGSSTDGWVFLDPYGAYRMESEGCYDPSAIRQYHSLIEE